MSNQDGILSHRTFVFDSFAVPVSEFYTLLERILKERAIPGAKVSRVYLSEGGLLGGSRQYVRVRRGADVFDISASVFGGRFMASYSLRNLPRRTGLKIFLGLILLWLIAGRLPAPIALFLYKFLFLVIVLAIFVGLPLYLFLKFMKKVPGSRLLWRGALALVRWGWQSLRLPTLHELDSRSAFHQSVPQVLEEALDALRSARGLRSLGEKTLTEAPAAG